MILRSSEIENTVEAHLARFQKRNNKLYLLIVLFIILSITSLFILRVDISVQANAFIRPHLEKIDLYMQQAGYIEKTILENGKKVKAGDKLIQLNAEKRNEERKVLRQKVAQISNWLSDLSQLTEFSFSQGTARMKSQRYLANHNSAKSEVTNLEKRIHFQEEQARKDKTAFDRGLIAKEKTSLSEEKLEEIKDKKLNLVNSIKKNWIEDKNRFQQEYDDIITKQRQLSLDRKNDFLLAPFAGTLEQVSPLSKGQFINTGKVAVLSPDSGLILEAYVLPKDIGLIKIGMPVRIQLDAFNYNQWGFVNGIVERISDDFLQMDKQIVFKVRASLNEKELQLKNGFVGKIRKGMTARARFVITNRKLSDLLFDRVSDWLHPASDVKE